MEGFRSAAILVAENIFRKPRSHSANNADTAIDFPHFDFYCNSIEFDDAFRYLCVGQNGNVLENKQDYVILNGDGVKFLKSVVVTTPRDL